MDASGPKNAMTDCEFVSNRELMLGPVEGAALSSYILAARARARDFETLHRARDVT